MLEAGTGIPEIYQMFVRLQALDIVKNERPKIVADDFVILLSLRLLERGETYRIQSGTPAIIEFHPMVVMKAMEAKTQESLLELKGQIRRALGQVEFMQNYTLNYKPRAKLLISDDGRVLRKAELAEKYEDDFTIIPHKVIFDIPIMKATYKGLTITVHGTPGCSVEQLKQEAMVKLDAAYNATLDAENG